MIQIYSISLGCPKNRVDTERTLGGIFNCKLVDNPESSDLIFINTCGFIKPAVQESIRTILEHIELVKKSSKKPLIAIAGCLIGRYGQKDLAKDLPEVDIWLDTKELSDWAEIIKNKLNIKDKSCNRLVEPSSYAWLKISEGCLHACSFCTIPKIRGPLQSTNKNILIEEAKNIVSKGIKELNVVAQDVTAWEKEIKGSRGLIELLEPLLEIEGLSWLRLMYLYPAGLTDELLSFLSKAGTPFVPYFDIPLQHASPSVLKNMGRPFAQNPMKVIDKVRKYFPDAALRTSIITGFPGETEEDFEMLCDFVSKVRFHNLGVFTYYAEEGTMAATMPNQIEDRIKEWRKDTIMEIQGDISEEILSNYLGTKQEVLVDEASPEWPGLFVGRTWFQAPEVDGVTYISGNSVKTMEMHIAEIVETQTYDLVSLADD